LLFYCLFLYKKFIINRGGIYIEEKDIAEFIGIPFSYTCVDGWIDGKVIDKVVTP